MQSPISYDKLVQKWAPVLNEETAGPISDHYRRQVTAAILENQENAMREEQMAGSFGMVNEAGSDTTDIGRFDPVLISLVRRSMPNMVAYDVCGVQPMTGPTGLIFAMKSRYKTARGVSVDDEALKDEAITGFSGDSSFSQTASTPPSGIIDSDFNNDADSAHDAERITNLNNTGVGMTTAVGENLGGSGVGAISEMGFTIEKQTVTAKTRALKAEYTMELAQDLKAIHGLDAETELANILSAEILAEINREVIRTINSQAKPGGALTSSGDASADFDLNLDADGRWSVEKFKGLILQLDKDANQIAKDTRRGRGNFVICSSNVASALVAAGMLDYSPSMSTDLQVDDTGNTFAGVLNGKMRVYIDPFATTDYATVGYKGPNAYDAGVFYCPYVPLTMVRAVGENTFQPKIGFKTRYGMVSNPFVGATPTSGLATAKTNQYYRIFRVANIL